MLQIKKKVRSIEGFFKNKINIVKIINPKKIKIIKLSIIEKGNSISEIPYDKESTLINLVSDEQIK